MYVYIETKSTNWSVGFFDPQGKFHEESNYNHPESAAKRVAWLNGEKIPHFSENRLTISEVIQSIEMKFKTDNNYRMYSRVANILNELSKKLIYIDQISEAKFKYVRAAGDKTWNLFQELIPRTKQLQSKYLEKSE